MDGLFNGVAVIIDDEIHATNSDIFLIRKEIEQSGAHVIGLSDIPIGPKALEHFDGVAFFVVDWQFAKSPDLTELGSVQIPQGLKDADAKRVSEFIDALSKRRHVPIFVFTNSEPSDVKRALKRYVAGYVKDGPTHILIKRKADIRELGALRVLDEWIARTPSAQALMLWEKQYQKARNALFRDFYARSIYWPALLYDVFEADGIDPSEELGRLISRVLLSRMEPFEFNISEFSKELEALDARTHRNALSLVLEAERFIAGDGLSAKRAMPGDVFKRDRKNYFINIRPECDCIDRNGEGVQLYLLRGTVLTGAEVTRQYSSTFGTIEERHTECVVFNIYQGKTIAFKFDKIVIEPWETLKESRVGRLLPPFVTRLQQRYAAYLQREALPRIPDLLIDKVTKGHDSLQ